MNGQVKRLMKLLRSGVWHAAPPALPMTSLQLPVPPLLQDPDEQIDIVPALDEEPVPEAEAAERKAGETGVFAAGAAAPIGGSAIRRGSAISAPTYRIVDMQLVEITTTKDGEENAKLVLGLDARIVEMEYLEATDDSLDVDVPELMGREGIVGQKEANPPAPEQLSAVIIGYTAPGHQGVHAAAHRCTRLP